MDLLKSFAEKSRQELPELPSAVRAVLERQESSQTLAGFRRALASLHPGPYQAAAKHMMPLPLPKEYYLTGGALRTSQTCSMPIWQNSYSRDKRFASLIQKSHNLPSKKATAAKTLQRKEKNEKISIAPFY